VVALDGVRDADYAHPIVGTAPAVTGEVAA
jgi:hypothetical protein